MSLRHPVPNLLVCIHIYTYTFYGIFVYICYPPDLIDALCSPPGNISEKYFTYRPVQNNLFDSPESDPPHKVMRYWFYYST